LTLLFGSLLRIPLQICLSILEPAFRRWTTPAHRSFVLETLSDLTRSRTELVAENALLRQQLVILHRQVKHPLLNRTDRFWLLALASRVANWKQALLIIQPDTLLRWHREGFHLFWRWKSRAKPKRTEPAPETIALIQQMADQNLTWGAERIRGEWLKLGIRVAKRTIQKYMQGVRPVRSPSQTWRTFLKNHAHEMWACDFLPVVDLFFRQVFVFFLIELGSRRVVQFGVTRNPTSEWVTQQLRDATPNGIGPKYLIRDNDSKFGVLFDRVAEASEIEIVKIPFRAPRAHAVCERFLGSLRRECLDHLLIFSDHQLYRVIKEDVGYFNRARPHQGIAHKIPEGSRVDEPPRGKGKIIAFPVRNGLHHDYRRAA
jgi:putative transposase